ncbi:probable serine/threonine-protein kinase samkC [Gymnodraco acuticeps]|uniref:Probable serine/threonine-protein kinase samkC n=1 Tax=Gymnodraco acuticeps TaxID=8218 RepID=A0A6P8STZ1_GYMAC|nr:probable serine/threonine-protein kinase samkC [Gymnodraco acuticeps]
MYFGLCVRVLVISLLIFGQQAKALSYRSGGSSGITPHFDFSRSLKPASTSSDDSSAQPERVLGSYSPFHADGALSETLKPAAAPSAGGYSGSHGRQVDGYSPEGSVSSYGPSQPIIRKPNQLPQANPSANGVIPSKAAPWAFPLSHNPNSFQSGIASSSAIVMHSGPYSKPQKPKNLPKPQQAGYKPKPHQPKPQPNPSIPLQPKPHQPKPQPNPSNPLQSWYQPKPQQTKPNQPSYPSSPLQAKPYQPSNPQQAKPYQPSYPSNPQQADPLQGVLQSKAGMWDFPSQGSVASGSNVQPTDSNSHLKVDPRSLREIPMPFPYQPRWPQQLLPV